METFTLPRMFQLGDMDRTADRETFCGKVVWQGAKIGFMGQDIRDEIGKYILRFSDEGQAHLWDSEYGDNYDVIEMPRLKALVRQRDELLESRERIHRRAQKAESENKRMHDDLVSLASLSREPDRRLPADLIRGIVERALGGSDVTEAAVAELDAALRAAIEAQPVSEEGML